MEDTTELQERERCPDGHLAAEHPIDRAKARDHFTKAHTHFDCFSDLMENPLDIPIFRIAKLTERGQAEVRSLARSYDEASARRGRTTRCIREDFE